MKIGIVTTIKIKNTTIVFVTNEYFFTCITSISLLFEILKPVSLKKLWRNVEIKKDEYIGIAEGEIVTSNETRIATIKSLLENLLNESSEIVTVMYGDTVDMKELEEVMLTIESHYPDVEVEVIEGNQDIYAYIIEVE